MHLYGKMPVPDPKIPLILVPNHSTWWDGFFVYLLNVMIFNRPLYLMMTDRQLQAFPFFAKVGAYSIPEQWSKEMVKSLQYTLDILSDQTKSAPLICIFPQGKLVPWSKRPLEYKKGLEWILKRYPGEVSVLPLAIKATFGEEQHPEVFFLFGESGFTRGANFPGTAWLEDREIVLLDNLTSMISEQKESTVLLEGKKSIHHRYRQFKQRIGWRI